MKRPVTKGRGSIDRHKTFDEFLAKDGLLAETEDAAIKEIIADQIKIAMDEQHLSKSEIAARVSTTIDKNVQHSTLRERITEHLFVGEALRILWERDITDVEVFRSEFDAHGYDFAMAQRKIVRHIQLKTSVKKPGKITVAQSLADKPSGCVIWILVTRDLKLGPYYWFGSTPGNQLPDISKHPNARRPTRNKSGGRPIRNNYREVPLSKFEQVKSLPEILEKLFGATNLRAK
jgi:hypothetical protein